MIKTDLKQPSETALNQCLGLKPSEKLLVVANPETISIGLALFETGLTITRESRLVIYPSGRINGEEPPDWVAEAMTETDVVIAPTTKSISHTEARRNACKAFNVRVATLPGITEEIFIRGLSADYDRIALLCKKVATALESHNMAYITSPSGTDLTVELGNKPMISDGNITSPGSFSNLPDGESELAPRNANGRLMVDRCGGYITEPTWIDIKDGYITAIQDNESGKRFRALIDEAKAQDGNNNAEYVAEFAIGTNPTATVTGVVLEDEKVLGTCHIAFGDNTSYHGGTNSSTLHMDVIVFSPTIRFDEDMIMESGKLLL